MKEEERESRHTHTLKRERNKKTGKTQRKKRK